MKVFFKKDTNSRLSIKLKEVGKNIKVKYLLLEELECNLRDNTLQNPLR